MHGGTDSNKTHRALDTLCVENSCQNARNRQSLAFRDVIVVRRTFSSIRNHVPAFQNRMPTITGLLDTCFNGTYKQSRGCLIACRHATSVCSWKSNVITLKTLVLPNSPAPASRENTMLNVAESPVSVLSEKQTWCKQHSFSFDVPVDSQFKRNTTMKETCWRGTRKNSQTVLWLSKGPEVVMQELFCLPEKEIGRTLGRPEVIELISKQHKLLCTQDENKIVCPKDVWAHRSHRWPCSWTCGRVQKRWNSEGERSNPGRRESEATHNLPFFSDN